jgi:hypothetical protein
LINNIKNSSLEKAKAFWNFVVYLISQGIRKEARIITNKILIIVKKKLRLFGTYMYTLSAKE